MDRQPAVVGKMFPAFPAHAQSTILRFRQEAHTQRTITNNKEVKKSFADPPTYLEHCLFINSVCPKWRHIATQICLNIVSGNDFLPDDTVSSYESMFSYIHMK